MPTLPVNQLPPASTISLDDLVIIEQLSGTVYTTRNATVRQLIGAAAPIPLITNLTWNGPIERLAIEGDNLLPTTLVLVDDIPYKFDTFVYGAIPNASNSATIDLGLSGLATGMHTVTVQNLTNESTSTFTF